MVCFYNEGAVYRLNNLGRERVFIDLMEIIFTVPAYLTVLSFTQQYIQSGLQIDSVHAVDSVFAIGVSLYVLWHVILFAKVQRKKKIDNHTSFEPCDVAF